MAVHKQTQKLLYTGILVWGIAICLLLNACSLPRGIPFMLVSKQDLVADTSHITAKPHLDKSEGMKQLQTLFQWIALLKTYGSDPTPYLPRYTASQQTLRAAQTTTQYNAVRATLQSQIDATQLAAMKTEALELYQQLDKDVDAYGQQHSYHDTYDNRTYSYGYAYTHQNGILGPLWTLGDLLSASNSADYQQIITELNMFRYTFEQMVLNSSDTTSGKVVHATDLALLDNYDDMKGRAIVVSLQEQMLRLYNNGQLVRAMPVTTGQPDLPTPPGAWQIEQKQQNITFHSSAAPGSIEWYPDTPIHDALTFHSNGYFIHDAWWRNDFGAGTEFPHDDPSGLEGSGRGSHGCINMSQDDAAWLDSNIAIATPVIVY